MEEFMKNKKKVSIAIQIFIALGLGIIAGIFFLLQTEQILQFVTLSHSEQFF
jgi:Na+/H+-dicarboxylate symporter